MMRITLAVVGKVKERYFTQAIEEYAKRLGRYCKLSIVQVADEKTPDQASQAQEEQIKEKEGQRLLAMLKDGCYVVALDIRGDMLDSVALAEKLASLASSGFGHVAFVIGGSLGLSTSVLARADYRLSFSPMTFPHQLMRVILLEQVYRGFRIIEGAPYHK